MKKHINIPVFIPHLGCPNQCVFCNQRTISGVENFKSENLRNIIDTALSTVSRDTCAEIAFFGGSFTGIDRNLMISLLEIAKEYIDAGKVDSVRCSTRPDYINPEIIKILKKYGVKTVELGLQSSDDEVLSISKRGHGFLSEKEACELITQSGLNLVGQMMIGLPGSTLEKEIKTAEFIINSGAVGARIYPTVVFRGTELCDMAESGLYEPISVEEAVSRSARVLEKFIDAGVDVIRIGLCSSENLASPDTYYGGPNHAALGELVINELFYNRFSEALLKLGDISESRIKITVAKGAISKAVGQKRINKERLIDRFSLKELTFRESAELSDYDFFVDITERKKRCI